MVLVAVSGLFVITSQLVITFVIDNYGSGSLLKLKNAKKLIKNSHFGHVKITL
jgi:hypothetical protein